MVQTTDSSIAVEVVYARPHKVDLIRLSLPKGCTLRQAVEASGLSQKHNDIDIENGRFGIFGKITKPDLVLRDRDRVEIYRSLIADPKEVRRRRAEEGKVTKKGGGATEA